MKILDAGHKYELDSLDGNETQTLTFVKREGPGYPGNVDSYPGTTMQEVLRALVQRAEYVYSQIPNYETEVAIEHMQEAIWLFERRAAKRHDRYSPSLKEALEGPFCKRCGHAGCSISEHPSQ